MPLPPPPPQKKAGSRLSPPSQNLAARALSHIQRHSDGVPLGPIWPIHLRASSKESLA